MTAQSQNKRLRFDSSSKQSNQRAQRTSHPLVERAGASGDDQILRDPDETTGQTEIEERG